MNKKKYAEISFYVLIALSVIYFSVWQGRYTYDPHHWGLMFSNAQDLVRGRVPYKDIFIQYGFLTTLIHYIGLLFFDNLISLIVITSIFYAAGIIGLGLIAKRLSREVMPSIYVMLLALLLHPLAIYPWSNYIAFPFLVFGIYFCITSESGKNYFLSGFFLGLSILSREGLLPAIFMISILVVIRLAIANISTKKELTLCFTAGLLSPLVLFAIYLFSNNIQYYWYLMSWILPGIYSTSFFPGGSILDPFSRFFESTIKLSLAGDIRWVLIAFIFLFNFGYIAFQIFREKRNYSLLLISLSSIFLVSTSLHIPEIFRISTGSVLGLVPIFLFFKNKKVNYLIFASFLFPLLLTIPSNSGNYFFPSQSIREESVIVRNHSLFNGQKWKPQVNSYYLQIGDVLQFMQRECGIKYHYNQTNDPIYQILSPFMPMQPGPFITDSKFNIYRSDYPLDEKIRDAADLIIFIRMHPATLVSYSPPPGFRILFTIDVPFTYFMPDGEKLIIIGPEKCKI